MGRMRLLILAEGGCLGGLSMLGVIILGFVLVGARLFSACIGFLLPLPGLLSIMMVWLVLLWSPMVWSVGALERRRVVHDVRDRAFVPGLLGTGMALFLRLIFLVVMLFCCLILLVCL